jgi:hypothetical protein
MKRAKTKKGNPRRFAVNQHVFPLRSLQRFADPTGHIMVRRGNPPKELRLKPNNPMFCAFRAWDERAEKGYMKRIEDRFQVLAREITAGRTSLEPTEFNAISQFYALCRLRSQHRTAPIIDQPVPGLTPEVLTLDQEENLEKNGYIFAGGTGIPGRMIAGLVIQRWIDYFQHQLKDKQWGIILALRGEFVVPDQFGESPIVPVTPKIALVADWANSSEDESTVRILNGQLVSAVKHYVAARNFAECPL